MTTRVDGDDIPVPNRWAVVSDDPDTHAPIALGTVGKNNLPIQNEEHAALIMRILDLDEIDFLDAGSSGSSEHVFMVCAVPRRFVINPKDDDGEQLEGSFELVSVNHHGGGALWFYVVQAGAWKSALRPLFLPDVVLKPGTGVIRDHAISDAHLRHNANRTGIAAKLRNDLRLDLVGGGSLTAPRSR